MVAIAICEGMINYFNNIIIRIIKSILKLLGEFLWSQLFALK